MHNKGLLSRGTGGAAVIALALAAALAVAATPTPGAAQGQGPESGPLKSRHLAESRERATKFPRGEADQALVDGWPLYRTERGQTAFNDAMATLKATDAAAPSSEVFKGCAELHCNLTLPAITADGWMPAGRLWVSPTDYALLVHSPRARSGQSPRRRALRSMRYFVLHEFHNSSRNNDAYDTISSHSGSVFVPLYMSKQGTDAKGRRFVVVVQVAPYDVASIHATNWGSAGPGIEVAKSANEPLEPLQALAGVAVAAIIKAAAPHLQVVNHRGAEGQPMLAAHERRLAALRGRATPTVTLPFVPAPPQRVATATGRLAELISRRGLSPVALAERGIVPRRLASASLIPAPVWARREPPAEPVLVEPITLAMPPPCAAEGGGPGVGSCRLRPGASQ